MSVGTDKRPTLRQFTTPFTVQLHLAGHLLERASERDEDLHVIG